MANKNENQYSQTFYKSLEMLKKIEDAGLVEEYARSNAFKDAVTEQKLLLGIVDAGSA